jgi:hypothetical protein
MFQLTMAENRRVPWSGSRACPVGPIVEAVLPGLIHARLGSILNEFLATYMANSKLSLPESMHPGLLDRVKFLGYSGHLLDPIALDRFTTGWAASVEQVEASCSWEELYEAIDLVESELKGLGLIGPRPQITPVSCRNDGEANGAVRGPWIFDENEDSHRDEGLCEIEWCAGRGNAPGRLSFEIRIPESPAVDKKSIMA